MSIKTVICPACKAEQAIMRDEDGNMNCAFCGHPLDLPDYEEGEDLDYIPEEEIKETTSKIEPVGDKIDAVFVLSEEEVGNAFQVSGKVKERKWIVIAEIIVFVLFGGGMLAMNIMALSGMETLNLFGLAEITLKKPQFIEWLYVVICAVMIPVILILPKRTKSKIIRRSTSGNQLELSIYENVMNVHINGHDEKDDWQLAFDGTFGVINQMGLFVLTLPNGQILAIPHRSLTDEQIPLVEQRLTSKEGK